MDLQTLTGIRVVKSLTQVIHTRRRNRYGVLNTCISKPFTTYDKREGPISCPDVEVLWDSPDVVTFLNTDVKGFE